MIIHRDIEQGTDEWRALRAGKYSASSASVFMSELSTKGFNDYVMTVAWGRKYGYADEPSFKNASTDRGHRLEPEALAWYVFETNTSVSLAGYVERKEGDIIGWSPDALIFDGAVLVAGVEIKCLEHKAFMCFLETREIPTIYAYQIQWAMWVAKLKYVDFVVYHPQHEGVVVRAYPDFDMHSRFEERLKIAEENVMYWLNILNKNEPDFVPESEEGNDFMGDEQGMMHELDIQF